MKLIQSSHSYNKVVAPLSESGFTLIELTVASFLGLLVGSLVMGTMLSARESLNFDLVRTRIDQNLRGALDIVSGDIRIGGENLTAAFPAFELINGSGTAPDELVVRRNLLDEVLSVCQNIPAGSSTPQAMFAIPAAATASCTYSGQTHNFNSWKAYRTANSGSVKAYIYNVSTKQGEFFDYASEVDGGTSYAIRRSSGNWVNAYPVNSSSIYLMEEWRFKMQSGSLILEENGVSATPKTITAGLKDFQVSMLMKDGTTKNSFLRTDTWSQIEAIEVTVSQQESLKKKLVTRSLRSRYFPRNILSQ